MSDQADTVTVVALQPIGYKATPEATNLTIAEPGSEVELPEAEAKQLVAEGSAAEQGSKEAKAATKAAKAEEADGEDGEPDEDEKSSGSSRSSGSGKRT